MSLHTLSETPLTINPGHSRNTTGTHDMHIKTSKNFTWVQRQRDCFKRGCSEQLYHCWDVKSCSKAQSSPDSKALLCKAATHCKCPLWKKSNKQIKKIATEVRNLLVPQVCGSYWKMKETWSLLLWLVWHDGFLVFETSTLIAKWNVCKSPSRHKGLSHLHLKPV